MNTFSHEPPRRLDARFSINFRASIFAGVLAILLNTAILIAAESVHIVTARGGLLTLLVKLAGVPVPPLVATWMFQQAFHIVIGVAMMVAYAVVLGNWRAPALAKGLLVAALVWLANACLVLPMIGQGFAGSRILSLTGALTFAVAHTVFFVVGAVLYERWR
ncbi:hypothetical protein [Paraburkholderia sp. SOS3]|jgi:hypothetical protein|uniref:hypothetical protein n=1 Tax=Paraburkholderia sp. SOS3 TaxID=1926494 RepID=UPI000947493F|nr:hypothetical protein [Paraburkholderia sp. SOS3]APR39160.1 hypothetical protein BTO02_27920 [Paraburkholderia sp. SOS3]